MGTILLTISILIVVASVTAWVLSRTISDEIKAGDKVHIYLEDTRYHLRYNRTATISGVDDDFFMIYDKVSIPCDFVGRFYAIGTLGDGSRVFFVKKKWMIALAIFTELFRDDRYEWEQD